MELRQVFEEESDLAIVYVMADSQINAKSLRFVDGLGLRERVLFASDRGSRAIDRLGLRRPEPEPIEVGVPEPTTYLLDRDGRVRFADARTDYQIWIDSAFLREQLAGLP